MGCLLPLGVYCKTRLAWRPDPPYHHNNNNYKKRNFSKTVFTKDSRTPKLKTLSPPPVDPFSPLPHLQLQTQYDPSHAIPHNGTFTKRTAFLLDTFHEKQRLGSLLEKLNKKGSSPVQILKDEGDWSKDHFWIVIRFLQSASRSKEAPQVFDLWTNIEKSRINEFNYNKIIRFLAEEGLMEEAVSALQKMKSHGLRLSLDIYNLIIHGFSTKGGFDDAMLFLNELEETSLKPNTETYDGLIQAYGKHKMYDEIGNCVKKMESSGCVPNHITYNLLIREFSRGGLIKRMESMYQTLLSKRMVLHPSTMVTMLEAYAKFGLLGKMEKIYRKVLNSKTPLKDGLVRKLAGVYIENYMFSRLNDLALDLYSETGMTDLVWCLRLLSHACILSRKGMDSVVGEMKVEKTSWNVTIANIILLAYMKMKDFKHLSILLTELPFHHVNADLVTVGIVFDANKIGFDGTGALNTWRRSGVLSQAVEMNTDPLVLTAFGKGDFLRSCEERYSSLEPKAREKKIWTYQDFIDLVFKPNVRQP